MPTVIKVRRLREESGEPEPGSNGVNSVDVVLKRGVSAFSSRLLRIPAGGHTAYHSHPREHTVLVISGQVRVEAEKETLSAGEAHVVAIPGGTPHRFFNPGPERLALLVLNMFPSEPVQETGAEPQPTTVTEPSPEAAPQPATGAPADTYGGAEPAANGP